MLLGWSAVFVDSYEFVIGRTPVEREVINNLKNPLMPWDF